MLPLLYWRYRDGIFYFRKAWFFACDNTCLKQAFSLHIRQGGEDGFQNSFLSLFSANGFGLERSKRLVRPFCFGGFVVVHDNRKNRIAGKAH